VGRRTAALVALVMAVAAAVPAAAQTAPAGFVDEFMGQFEGSARKLVALAEAMPADRYAWRPAAGVASVSEVAMHIARYNLMYPEQNLGVTAPAELAGYGDWEETVTDKAQVVRLLAASMDHVRAVAGGMGASDLDKGTTLYGREVAQWAVLLQLLAHMNEHLGQSIAYARMNGVVPPWSR
jgi:uncharacterized damage-inducible protein DinB